MDNGWIQVIPEGISRRLAAGWLALGAAALGASTLFAILLVVSRTPYLGKLLPGHDFFHAALVLHVNLSALIWFLAFAGVAWSIAGGERLRIAGWIALALAAAGTLVVIVAPFVGTATPMISNYVPVLHSSLFLAGLGLFAAGFVVLLARALVTAWPGARGGEDEGVVGRGLYAAALAMLMALVSLAWSFGALPGDLHPGAYYELLFWGPGHTLQFAHTLLMMAAWLWLLRSCGAPLPFGRRAIGLLFLAALLPALAAPLVHAGFSPGSGEFREGFTAFMRWGTWPAPLILGAGIAVALARHRNAAPGAGPLRMALILSMALFAAGAIIGSLIRQDNAMVPAHYHGTIGAVTLAFMGLAIRLLPGLGLAAPNGGLARWQPLAYGGGTLLMAVALAWSGGHGVARKVSGSAQILDTAQEVAGMVVVGLGGLVAVAGSLMFFFLVLRALGLMTLGRAAPAMAGAVRAGARGRRADRRPLAIALTLGVIAAVGAAVALIPGVATKSSVVLGSALPDSRKDPRAHVREARRAEIAERFQQSVVMLHARQYEHAVAALHRVLELDPMLPEAHVNMGYAMIGLERYKVAKDFFESATELRPTQANAYYGLALAHEALGELPLAIGAMRTYLHLTPPEDPYVRKAQTALWEWQNQADLQRFRGSGKSESLPGNGKK